MADRILFGAAYYEEYLTEDRLDRDIDLMKAAGINVIRIAESTWSVEEPSDGVFDFSHVTRTIEAAAKRGIDVIIGTPTYAVPSWLCNKHPEILAGNKFGPRQNMDITDPVYRQYAERIIRRLVSLTAGYPNVIGFQVDNETKHYGVHTPAVVSGFRDWLRDRFDGDIQAVNDAYGLYHWSNSVASFEDLPDPEGSVNAGYIGAFEEYRRGLATEFLAWQADIIREYKRDDQFITHNFDYQWKELSGEGIQMGCSDGLQPDLNDFEVAKALDIAATDIYFPCADDFTGKEIAFGGDLIRSLKKSPYIVMESQAQAFTGWLPYPGQLRMMAYSHIASGARGILYWPWLSIHSGIESYWKGVLSHDGQPGVIYDEISRIGSELKEHADLLLSLNKRNRIAIVVSPEALHALKHFPTDNGLTYNDIVDLFYRCFYETGLECDVIYDREKDWSGYDLIVFPQLYCCNEEFIARVKRFVAEGGTVMASFRSFFADENLRIWNDAQPHGLTDVFGMHYSLFTRDSGCCWQELLETGAAEQISGYDNKYRSGYASVTRNDYGKGHAWYVGAVPSEDELKGYIRDACRDAGIELTGTSWPVTARNAYTEDGRKVCFLFNYSSDSQTVDSPVSGTDIFTAETISEGDRLILGDWDLRVIVSQ